MSKTKTYKKLSHELLLWFLLLSITPLTFISLFSYYQAQSSLIKSAAHELEEITELNSRFVKNWFDYRFMDIKNLAGNTNSRQQLHNLVTAYQRSGQPVAKFSSSKQQAEIIKDYADDLKSFQQQYDYVDNIFLLDKQGNILHSIYSAAETGTNLKYGVYADSRFASGYNRTVNHLEVAFSGLEKINNETRAVSYITAPVFNTTGEMTGVIAISLKLKRIYELLERKGSRRVSLQHYIVGLDGYLRTPIKNEREVLTKKIDTLQVKKIQQEHLYSHDVEESWLEKHFIYTGPLGNEVIGKHKVVKMPGIQWVLVSELDRDEALRSAEWLADITMLTVYITMAVVIFVSIAVARRITRPVSQLAEGTRQLVNSDTFEPVQSQSKNEIGQLADIFNTVMQKRLQRDMQLKKQTRETGLALKELAEQKFALDQHSVVDITDLDGRITFVNNNFCELCGYSQNELLGQNHRLLNSGYHDAEFFKAMYSTITGGLVWQGEICNRAKSGENYWVESTIVPFKDEHGHPKSYVAIYTDITQRKLSEEALAKSESRIRAILHSVADAIITTRSDGAIVDTNPAAEEVFGYSRNEIIGKKIDELVSENTSDMQSVNNARNLVDRYSNKLGVSVELLGRRKDGEQIPIEMTLSEIARSDEARYTALIKDITQRKNVETELIVARDLAEAAVKTKSEFLASMSHEIRTPMNGVIGMLSLLRNTELDDVQLHRVKIAQNSAQSLLNLINDILDFSKVEAGKLELEYLDFNIHEMLGDLAEALVQAAEEKGLELILDLSEIEVSRVVGDPARIRQVLTNLVSNAIKFTDQGEIVITARLTSYGHEAQLLNISVKDSGIGIPENKQHRLFNSFSQVDASTTRKYGGTGLGLAIAKQLCQLMNGDISVSSESGKGSVFEFSVLVQRSDNAVNVTAPFEIADRQILVVDDSVTNANVLRRQLQRWGASIEIVYSGKQALKVCQQHIDKGVPVYDLLIIDMEMPMMNGVELAKMIRRNDQYRDIKLVLMTTMGFDDEVNRLQQIGFDAHFPKPVTIKDLIGAISVLIRDKTDENEKETDTKLSDAADVEPIASGRDWNSDIRVMVVEDNPVNQLVAKATLEEIGVSVDVAGNGIEAIDILKQRPDDGLISMIFMDCQMPEMDGYEASNKIRQGEAGLLYREIPIVALTANAMHEDREKCLNAGMNDYLAKPFTPPQLEEKLAAWIQT